ncbi:MAG TPA: hypothetical protein VFI90_08555 [Rubrobacter sp.]|nr:hypothetical protein [Rubrobacter sp.]
MVGQYGVLALAAWLLFLALGVPRVVLGTVLTPVLEVVADEGSRTLTPQ